MAQAIKAHVVVTIQRGSRVTAVSMLLSRSVQWAAITQMVTLATCRISRVERIASPCAVRLNIRLSIRLAMVKSDARKKTQAMHTAPYVVNQARARVAKLLAQGLFSNETRITRSITR